MPGFQMQYSLPCCNEIKFMLQIPNICFNSLPPLILFSCMSKMTGNQFAILLTKSLPKTSCLLTKDSVPVTNRLDTEDTIELNGNCKS